MIFFLICQFKKINEIFVLVKSDDPVKYLIRANNKSQTVTINLVEKFPMTFGIVYLAIPSLNLIIVFCQDGFIDPERLGETYPLA